MKKIFSFLMLISIIGTSYAQEGRTKTERTFELPPNYAQRRFTIDLDRGNKLQIELGNMEDIKHIINMDSLLRIFLEDIEPLKDSLMNELVSKRIDYLTDSFGMKKIRLLQYPPKSSSFLVNDGEVSALKLEQDTVNFIGSVPFIADYGFRKPFNDVRHYKVSFFVNRIADLASYMDGSVSAKLRTLQQNVNTTWITTRQKGTAILKADEDIKARLTKGYVAGGDYLSMRLSVDVQNYKKYFVPSFSLGAGLILSNPFWKRELVLSWDPHFFFSKNAEGKLKTFRNDFLTLTAGQGPVRDNEPRKESHLVTIISFGYLVKHEGDYFEKGTMRFGAGRLSLFEGKTKIEPAIYFTDLFKGVTPGLRWIQSF